MDIVQFHKEQEKFKAQREKMHKVKIANLEFKQYTELVGILNKSNIDLSQNIIYQQNKNASLVSQIKTMQKNLHELNIQYKALINSEDQENIRQILEIKKTAIRTKLKDILDKKFPEIKQYGRENIPQNAQNEYYNMTYDYVIVYYFEYNELTNKISSKSKQKFKISKNSTFSSLKNTSENFWGIYNIEDYIFTDEIEGVLADDEDVIYDYLRKYSIKSNVILLLPITLLNQRTTPLLEQENKMKEMNNTKRKTQTDENIINNNINAEKTQQEQKISMFESMFVGLKPYYSIGKKKNGNESNSLLSSLSNDEAAINKKVSKDFSMSFIMLISTLSIIIFTLLLINRREMNMVNNNQKIDYIKHLFNTTKINDYQSLYIFFIKSIGFNLIKYTSLDEQFNSSEITKIPIYSYLLALFNNDLELNKFFMNESIDSEGLSNKVIEYQKDKINFIPISSIHIVYKSKVEIKCSETTIVSQIINSNTKCYKEGIEKPKINAVYETVTQQTNNSKFQLWLTQLKDTNNFDIDLTNTNIVDLIIFFAFLIPIDSNFQKPKVNGSTLLDYEKNSFYFFVNERLSCLSIYFTLYYPNDDLYLSCKIDINNSNMGKIEPGESFFKLFQINIFNEKKYLILEILRFILSFMYVVNNIVIYLSKNKKLMREIFSYNSIFNFLIFGLILFSLTYKLLYLYEKSNVSKFLENNIYQKKYLNSYHIAKQYQFISSFESFIFGLMIMKLIQFGKLSQKFQLIFILSSKSASILFKYISFILIIIFGFGQTYLMFFPQIKGFWSSMYNIVLFSLGIFDYNKLLDYCGVSIVVIGTIIILFYLLFTLSAFIGIYSESLRIIIVNHGYPYENKFEWNKEDYLVWLIPCLKNKKNKKN